MGHNWEDGSREDGHTLEDGSPLPKWVTLCKMGHTWEDGPHLVKWVTIGKMGHTW